MVRDLTADEVEFEVFCEPEYTPIKGNASAIDDETDSKIERWIEKQLDKGNQWAWCSVRVVARWKEWEGDDYLGCCSYKSKKDFCRPGDYYDDMKNMALEELNKKVAASSKAIAALDKE